MARKKKAPAERLKLDSVIECNLGKTATLDEIFKAIEAELARDGVTSVSVKITK